MSTFVIFRHHFPPILVTIFVTTPVGDHFGQMVKGQKVKKCQGIHDIFIEQEGIISYADDLFKT